MFESNLRFIRDLKRLDSIHFKDLVELQEYQQKLNFFELTDARDSDIPTHRLPIVKAIFSTTVKALHNSQRGQTVSVEGYLEPLYSNKALSEKIFRFASKADVASIGFKTYNFYAEPSRKPTEVIVLASSGLGVDVSPDLPYSLKLEMVGRLEEKDDCKSILMLKDEPEPTILKIPKIELPFPLLSLKELRKGLAEVSSLSRGDEHVCNSLISPFIGSDFFNKKLIVDGIGSSYMQNSGLQADVGKLNDILKTSAYGLSLEQFGVFNISAGLAEDMDKMRTNSQTLQKFRTLSWNMPTSKEVNNLKLSEFRYKSEAFNIDSGRDIRNNIALQHSLAYYAIIKNKAVKQSVYDESLLKAITYINSLKEAKDIVFDIIIDEIKLPSQVGRMLSFFTAFDASDSDLVKLAKSTLITGIDSTADDIVALKSEHMTDEFGGVGYISKKHTLGKGVPLGVWSAIFSSDRTKDSIVEKIMDKFGWSAKRAEEQLTQLHEEGQIICPDGVHYRLLSETKYNLRQG